MEIPTPEEDTEVTNFAEFNGTITNFWPWTEGNGGRYPFSGKLTFFLDYPKAPANPIEAEAECTVVVDFQGALLTVKFPNLDDLKKRGENNEEQGDEGPQDTSTQPQEAQTVNPPVDYVVPASNRDEESNPEKNPETIQPPDEVDGTGLENGNSDPTNQTESEALTEDAPPATDDAATDAAADDAAGGDEGADAAEKGDGCGTASEPTLFLMLCAMFLLIPARRRVRLEKLDF